MAKAPKHDPYGQKYWDLTDDQKHVFAALPIEFSSIRKVFEQVRKDTGCKVQRVNWEKLHVLGLLEVNLENRKGVYVKRGRVWEEKFGGKGEQITRKTMELHEIVNQVNEIFAKNDKAMSS